MIDSHAHLNTPPLLDNLELEIKEFVIKGGNHILNCSYDLKSIYEAISIQNKYDYIKSGIILTAIGIHPEEYVPQSDLCNKDISLDSTRILLNEYTNILKRYNKTILALGETGLDYYQLFRENIEVSIDIQHSIELQKISFRRHLELAIKYNKPVIIHCRDKISDDSCVKDALGIICEMGRGKITGVFHSYTGDIAHLDSIIDLGFYISFNAIITYKNAQNVRDLLFRVPEDRILIETDAPLLPLRNSKCKYGSPKDIFEIAQTMAEIKNITKEKALTLAEVNFKNLFRLF